MRPKKNTEEYDLRGIRERLKLFGQGQVHISILVSLAVAICTFTEHRAHYPMCYPLDTNTYSMSQKERKGIVLDETNDVFIFD